MSRGAILVDARVEILLRSRRARRALAGAAAQHGSAALFLASAGIEGLGSGHGSPWLSWASILVGAALVVAAVKEVRTLRRHGVEHYALPVVDLLAVPLLLLEALHLHEQGKRWLPWAYALIAVITLLRILVRRRLYRLRRLDLDFSGIDLRSPLSHQRAAWADLAAVERSPAGLRLLRRDGEVLELDLGDLENRAEAESAILAAAARALPSADVDAEA